MNDEIVRLQSTLHERYADTAHAVKLAVITQELVELTAKGLEKCSLAKPGKGKNWVEDEGGLPAYICNVAKEILRSNPSYDTGHAIAAAVSQIKKWIADPKTSASTKAKATAAIAQWEAKKSAAKAKPNKK